MDLTFLAQADQVTLKLELAKSALEAAKAAFDQAKQAYDDLLNQTDTHGIPKAKLKKLTEDRVQALFENGLVSVTRAEAKPAESKRPRKAKIEAEVVGETWPAEPQDAEISFLSSRKEAAEAHA
jgi:hypothetical protein